MMTLRVAVVLGTIRPARKTEYLARFVHQRLAVRSDVTAEWIDAAEYDFGNLKQRLKDREEVPDTMQRLNELLSACDGFIWVAPEYNHGYPGALKNLIDHFGPQWKRKPVALVTGGGISGGLRAMEQLRLVTAGVGAVSVPRGLPVPRVGDEFGPDGPKDVEAWTRRVDGLLDETLWYANALGTARRSEQD